jgi:bifunctional non-homologous end joining protein LigD
MTARRAQSVTAGGIRVGLSNLSKVLFPDDDITKGDLVKYYRDVAGRVLPYLSERPIVMARYPDGIVGQRVFQKNVPGYFPDWVSRAEVKKAGGSLNHVICDKPATLVYLANQACIEIHVFLSRIGRLDHPDQLVFDLDPPDQSHFDDARCAALRLRQLLEDELELTAFVKTTGGKGLHVHVPLDQGSDFGAVRAFARQAAGLLVARNPGLATTEQRKGRRGSSVYADIMRNAYAQTVVAPYAVRARPGAPVATPLHWDEVADSELVPERFTLRTIRSRLGELDKASDPWGALTSRRCGLARAKVRLDEIAGGGIPPAVARQ